MLFKDLESILDGWIHYCKSIKHNNRILGGELVSVFSAASLQSQGCQLQKG